MSHTQKTIVITGATAGIGRHAALYLAARGHHVIATGRRQDALQALFTEARESSEAGGRVDVVRLDVTDDTSIQAAKAEIEELVGEHGVDVLINNAGYGQGAPLAEATDADIRKQFDTNVFGLMSVTRAFLGEMIVRRQGRIINVSSIGGRITFPMMGVYHASKYAVEALSDALRMELAPFGIHVSIIEPGPIQTNFVARLNEEAQDYRKGSLYAAAFEQADKVEAQAMSMASGPAVISRAIYKAVTARRPKARYVAPLSGHITLKLLQLLPLRLRDWLMRGMFGLTPKRLSAGRPEGEPTALQIA